MEKVVWGLLFAILPVFFLLSEDFFYLGVSSIFESVLVYCLLSIPIKEKVDLRKDFAKQLQEFSSVIPKHKPSRMKLEQKAISLVKSQRKVFSVDLVLSILENAYGVLGKRKGLIRPELSFLLSK